MRDLLRCCWVDAGSVAGCRCSLPREKLLAFFPPCCVFMRIPPYRYLSLFCRVPSIPPPVHYLGQSESAPSTGPRRREVAPGSRKMMIVISRSEETAISQEDAAMSMPQFHDDPSISTTNVSAVYMLDRVTGRVKEDHATLPSMLSLRARLGVRDTRHCALTSRKNWMP